MAEPRPRLTSRDDVLATLCHAWAEASELWDADDVAPLGYAYRRLCEVAGDQWGATLDQEDYDRFMHDTLS